MNLLGVGCSIVFGDELADCTSTQHSRSTFPALLAKNLNLNYQCVAVPGSGSDSQVRKVLENCNSNTAFVVVAWSFLHRYDWHWSDHGWRSLRFPGQVANNSTPQAQIDKFKQYFFANVSDDYAWYHYAKDVVFLQQWLSQRQVPYVFCSVDSGFNINASAEPSYQTLWQAVDRHRWFDWRLDGVVQGFQNWCVGSAKTDKKFSLGSGGHPLEHAHAVSAQQITEFIQQRKLI